MAEDATTTEVNTEGTEEAQQTQVVEGEEETTTEETEGAAEEQETPEARLERMEKQLKEVREEAAKRRIENKKLQDDLKAAKTPEEFAAAISEYETKISTLERENALAQYDIPEDLLPLLEGKDAEEIHKLAPTLSKYAPKKQVKKETSLNDLSGGLNPTGHLEGSELSAQELAKRIPRRR